MIFYKKYKNIIFYVIIFIFITVLFISLASNDKIIKNFFGDGRGDWTIKLTEQYSICRINKTEIFITYRENPEQLLQDSVLPNFSIVSYQMVNEYICLDGYERTEQINNDRNKQYNIKAYYLINTIDHNIYGPFRSDEEFFQFCKEISLIISPIWNRTRDKGSVRLPPDS